MSKLLEKFYDALFANDDILCFLEDFGNITFFVYKMGIFSADLDKI